MGELKANVSTLEAEVSELRDDNSEYQAEIEVLRELPQQPKGSQVPLVGAKKISQQVQGAMRICIRFSER